MLCLKYKSVQTPYLLNCCIKAISHTDTRYCDVYPNVSNVLVHSLCDVRHPQDLRKTDSHKHERKANLVLIKAPAAFACRYFVQISILGPAVLNQTAETNKKLKCLNLLLLGET